MANSFYSYLAFILPDANANIDTLKNALTDFYSGPEIENQPTVSMNENEITVRFEDDYTFHIAFSNDAHVNVEARELAEEQALDWNEAAFDKAALARSTSRFEIWGEEDYDMDYFNDSLFIIQKIEEFNGVIIFQNN
ncbi:hypothetical protein [Chitinophaga sp. RAB17]|uniref:hypothetical protein n=1 Tax=Chitinophaga sp. RAB17 TaxID=3233049 RepID=UPI003F8EFBD6